MRDQMTYFWTFVQIRLQICVDTFLQIALHDGTQIDTRPLNVLFKRFEKLSYFESEKCYVIMKQNKNRCSEKLKYRAI